ncbi:MAG: PKD domain-containing protein [bacterium]
MLMVLLAGCGGRSDAGLESGNSATGVQTLHGSGLPQEQPGSGVAEQTAEPLSMEALESFLQAELARLEMQRSASAAPGADSAVFSLSAVRISEPSEQQNRVELRWTKHLPGDYDGNGEVNAADLVPLGQRWGRQVSYLPEAESGIAHYPAGDRHDGALGQQNWLGSYVDGNHDGVVGIADVTVIAQHWRQRYTGYRIYRRNLELGNGVLLPMPDVEDSPISVSRQADDPLLREYVYVDMLDIPGSYEYSVRAWDEYTDTEAPDSNIAPYLVNMLPLAEFDYEILVADEPYTLAFSAAGSTDPDGSIVSYAWDLDGDGEFADAADSAEIEAVLPAGFPHVQLRVTDDQGGQSTVGENILLPALLNLQLQVDESEAIAPHTFTVTPLLSGSMPAVQYEWYEGADETPVALAFTPEPQQFTVSSPGTTSARLKVKGEDGIYREASLPLQCHAALGVSASVDSDHGIAPAEFRVNVSGFTGADPRFRLLVDSVPQDEYSERIKWQHAIEERGSAELQVQAIDKFGNTALSDAFTVSAQALPVVTFGYGPSFGTAPFDVNWGISAIEDPDNLLQQILVKLPQGGTVGDTGVSLKNGTYSTGAGYGEYSREYFKLTLEMLNYPDLSEEFLLEIGFLQADFSITPGSYMGNGVRAEVDITDYSGYPQINIHEWFVDGGGGSNWNEFSFTTDWLEPGIHEVRLDATNSLDAVRSFSHTMQVWPVETDVAIIRNDGGTYSTNLDAIKDDLDSLALSWQEFPYTDNIATELLSHGNFVVLWYRGGPGDDLEPRQETMWTTAEIDNYIAILEQGRPLLMMSQNNSKLTDFSNPAAFGGWEHHYGAEILDYTLPGSEYRHPWASALRTDDGTGIGFGFFFQSSPTSFNADLDYLRPSTSWNGRGENYIAVGSSAARPLQLSVGNGCQFMGIGWYDGSPASSPVPELGLAPNETGEGLTLGHLSWGTESAPYRNVGFFPGYNGNDHGNTRHWVVGYPWAAVDITQSEPAGMTRADMLQNIIAWLKVDYDPQF